MKSSPALAPILCVFASILAVSGAQPPAIDAAMREIMEKRSIGAGVICVARGDEIIFEQGYGHLDREKTRALPDDAIMRIASLAKPITAAAVRTLVREGKISLDDKVIELLKIEPHADPDPRLGEITIQHLLDHKGGWDRDKSGDPMFKAIEIAEDLGVESPPSREQIASWVFGRPLDFAPGERRAYSNFGYLLLGRVIETITGEDATTWIRKNIVNSDDFILARTFPNARDPREPHYFHPGPKTPNVYAPKRKVDWPDGGWDSESMDTHGGWAITARAYTEFLTRYWINGEQRGDEAYEFIFHGSLPGTWSIARQRPDGVSWTAIFNQRKDASGLPYKTMHEEIDAAVARVSISDE